MGEHPEFQLLGLETQGDFALQGESAAHRRFYALGNIPSPVCKSPPLGLD